VQVGEVSSLIIEKVKTMAKAEGPAELRTKRKVIATLLPYAVMQERNGRSEMLDVFLDAARASRTWGFAWDRANDLTCTLLHEATPRTIVLVLPHIQWPVLTDDEDLVQRWVEAVSAVQYTEEVARCVVEILLLVASDVTRLHHPTIDVWSWLTKRPSLSPFCRGRYQGSRRCVVEAVRGLGNIEILKSYLLVAWSEWNALRDGGFDEMCVSLREDFGGVGMGHHRVDLIQRLDLILERLGRGPGYFKRNGRALEEDYIQKVQNQYENLKRILLETDNGAFSRMSYSMIILLWILIQADIHRISPNVYVCASSAVSIDPLLEPSVSLIPPRPLRL